MAIPHLSEGVRAWSTERSESTCGALLAPTRFARVLSFGSELLLAGAPELGLDFGRSFIAAQPKQRLGNLTMPRPPVMRLAQLIGG